MKRFLFNLMFLFLIFGMVYVNAAAVPVNGSPAFNGAAFVNGNGNGNGSPAFPVDSAALGFAALGFALPKRGKGTDGETNDSPETPELPAESAARKAARKAVEKARAAVAASYAPKSCYTNEKRQPLFDSLAQAETALASIVKAESKGKKAPGTNAGGTKTARVSVSVRLYIETNAARLFDMVFNVKGTPETSAALDAAEKARPLGTSGVSRRCEAATGSLELAAQFLRESLAGGHAALPSANWINSYNNAGIDGERRAIRGMIQGIAHKGNTRYTGAEGTLTHELYTAWKAAAARK